MFHICIRITVCIVVQFISVDQPQRKQRACRDWSLSRCFSSGSVVACWLEFPLLYRLQLCKSTHFLPVGYPQRILIIRKERGNTGGLAIIWKIQLDSAHMLKQYDRKKSTAAIHRPGPWLLESCMEEYTLIFHCTAVKALLTLHLHMLCIYCKNIIQGPLLEETEEYNTLDLKRL